ncbi:CoF synthetase [Flavobacteriaceae bacterium F89]|uniref:CoF synthetase n=1 Tax=Cerina litoralis TaxID=2874477 RepID=A0AAE3EVB0_9FLAO|nr:CoF synthetase [Cerina litoralis]MCG2461185.1 CoF synthetase [Cerina litoralis]
MSINHVLEILRRWGFWILDFAKGSSIRNHYNEIRQILENPNSSKAEELRKNNLQKILKHAISTTPFYLDYVNCKSLEDFPVINKNMILNRYDQFKSEKFLRSKLHKASSSGSTGIPFSILQNVAKKTRNTADTIYYGHIVNNLIGNKLYYLKLWSSKNYKSKWSLFAQNIVVHNIMDSSDKDIAALLKRIQKDSSNKTILGYPSFFALICNYIDHHGYSAKELRIKSIISFAESLSEDVQIKISKYFGTQVYARYSNQENGIIAQQTKNSKNKYLLNWASYFIEILEIDSDNHVPSGGLGRVVVTDLFNYAMPMIRYDTGDMAIYEETDYGYPVLSKIYGRRADMIYNTKGEIVLPMIFYRILDYSKASQFQFIQKNKYDYVFKLNAKIEDTKENEARQFFYDYLGNDANIDFEYVVEIPVLSSGKRKEVSNLYIQK